MMSRVSIGGLLLESIEGWTFHVQADGAVTGRRNGDRGLMRIFSLKPNQLQQPVTHEECFAIAVAVADVIGAMPLDRRMKQSAVGPLGSARFRRGDDVVRIWYCYRPSGLIIGTYACSLEASRTEECQNISRQCGHIIGSAMFDRTSWGGEDDLTKFLVAKLAEDEPLFNADQSM